MHLPGTGIVCRVHRSSCLRKLLREKTMWFTSTLVLGTAVFCATGERRLRGAGTLFPSTAVADFSHGWLICCSRLTTDTGHSLRCPR